MTAFRSILFNIMFYGIWTPFCCLAGLPFLLISRQATLSFCKFYTRGVGLLEKYILRLTYEIRGLENRPAPGTPYLVASKHQSAYETLKLFDLFDDPSIILKRELLWLPVFGWYLQRLEVVAIDRGNKEKALTSLYAGAHKMKDNNRPIIIFPQGTRTRIEATPKEKPYKGGILKLYTELNLPIIPVALNSGAYWPRNSFWKKSGTVIFEFLPPIEPGQPPVDVLHRIENLLETRSAALVTEARARIDG